MLSSYQEKKKVKVILDYIGMERMIIDFLIFQVIAVAKSSDLVLMVLDGSKVSGTDQLVLDIFFSAFLNCTNQIHRHANPFCDYCHCANNFVFVLFNKGKSVIACFSEAALVTVCYQRSMWNTVHMLIN